MIMAMLVRVVVFMVVIMMSVRVVAVVVRMLFVRVVVVVVRMLFGRVVVVVVRMLFVRVVVRMRVRRMIRMRMAVIVVVTMMSVAECCETNNVDEKSERANQQELIQAAQFVAFVQSVSCVEDDFNADKDQEDPVGKARQGADLAIAIWEACRRWPLAHDSGCKSHCQPKAIEKHMDAVSQQT